MSEEIKLQETPSYTRMTGEVYDLIYSEKDYAGEVAKLKELVAGQCESGGSKVLVAACGTGRHVEHLVDEYDVDGFDLSSEQVTAAKKKFPDLNIFEGDMRDFETENAYDVVTCLFSSIGYAHTKEELDRTIANFAKHTKPGGLVLVEPWLSADQFEAGHFSVETQSNQHLSVARMGISSQEGNLSVLSMHHMVGTSEGAEHFLEEHRLAMHSDKDFTDAFQKAGLEVEIDPEGLTGRRLCIGKNH